MIFGYLILVFVCFVSLRSVSFRALGARIFFYLYNCLCVACMRCDIIVIYVLYLCSMLMLNQMAWKYQNKHNTSHQSTVADTLCLLIFLLLLLSISQFCCFYSLTLLLMCKTFLYIFFIVRTFKRIYDGVIGSPSR